MRTNSLVALGGALFTIIGLLLSEGDASATSRVLIALSLLVLALGEKVDRWLHRA